MGVINDAVLQDFFDREPAEAFRIEGVVQTTDAVYLGQLGLHKTDPVCRFGYWFKLSDQARLYTRPLVHEEAGIHGLAVIFRQFDRSRFQDEPSEMLAGWVPEAQAAQAAQWVRDFNAHIQHLLTIKHAQ